MMTIRRCIGMMLAASVLFMAASVADAFPIFRRSTIPPVYNVYPYGYVYPQFNPYASQFGPYATPLPAYGVMPLPLATYQMWGLDRSNEYSPSTNEMLYLPRARPSVYPAVPYDPTPTKSIDKTRARFDITVPTPNAVLLFDGVKTSQTGLQRTFSTPVLAEGKQYSATIEVQWQDEVGTKLTRRRTFEFMPGDVITHKFSE